MKGSKKKAKDDGMSPFARAALKAMIEARREAEKENARWGLPMIFTRNGRIVRKRARK